MLITKIMCVVPQRSLERFLIFAWLGQLFSLLSPMVQDNSLHPIFKLASIFRLFVLCVIAANSVSSIVHSFFSGKRSQVHGKFLFMGIGLYRIPSRYHYFIDYCCYFICSSVLVYLSKGLLEGCLKILGFQF